MKKPETILEQLYFVTVRIEATLSDLTKSAGTGFLFNYIRNDQSYLFVVTNKHVIKDAMNGMMLFNQSDGTRPLLGFHHSVTFDNFESGWITHSDEDIDIAIFPFTEVVKNVESKGQKIYFKSINQSMIPTESDLSESIDAIEDIVFIGYPNDIYDKANLLPVVRKGTTATPISVDFDGKPVFLIDASVFPGSSGSPVFICNVGSYSPRGKGIVAGNRLYFLGLVASVFLRTDKNTVELIEIPTQQVPIVQTSQMIDLGIVFKASLVQELIEEAIAKAETA